MVAFLVNKYDQFAITGRKEEALEAANDAVLVTRKVA